MDSKSKLEEFVTSASDMARFLEFKALHHNNYKWYTMEERVAYDLKESAIFLNTGSNWNDVLDRNNFNTVPGKRRFGFCLSYSKSESVAMWMLYGGRAQKGAMIDFRRNMITDLKNTESIELGVFDDNKFKTLQTLDNSKFIINLADVLYIAQQDDGFYTIKKSDKVIENVDDTVVSTFRGITKGFPWNYENECRLVVEVEENAISDKAKDADIVKLIIPNMNDNLIGRIYHAPNYDDALGYKYSKSSLKGTIKWEI